MRATFFLSTGRCGTQWLAAHLGAVYGDMAAVEHEPLQTEYRPRIMLASPSGGNPQPTEEAVAHLERIRRGLATKDYIECGYPCWSSLPWIAETLGQEISVVHLTREPAATATSWVVRGAFVPPILPHVPERILLTPFDAGARFTEYQQVWPTLAPLEKALVYWAEVNAFGLHIEPRFSVRWLRLRYEDLFGGDGAEALLDFLGLPERPAFLEARVKREDCYRFFPTSLCDPRALDRHPAITTLAHRLGY